MIRAWLLVGLALRAAPAQDVPPALYLTWQRDPATTMTVCWHTVGPEPAPLVRWRPADGGELGVTRARSHPLPHSDRMVHVAEVTGLAVDTTYRFRVGRWTAEHRFRTLPLEPTRPVRLVCGGDTMHAQKLFESTLAAAARTGPDLIAFGGDLAYANGAKDGVGRWYQWLDTWTRTAIAPDGRRIPVVCAIGNHEVRGGYGQKPDQAPFFHAVFPFPTRRGYGVLDLGKDISLFLLNTHHTAPLKGDQTEWLEQELRRRRDRGHLFAIYHVPGFPSHRSFTGLGSIGVRAFWAPIFDRHGLDVAFENHDHTYKRSPRIKGGRVDPEGTLYLGDGCFGVVGRPPRSPVDSWWLERTDLKLHFILTTVAGDRRTHEAIDVTGKVIDRWPPDPATSTEALHALLQREADAFLAASRTPGMQIAVIRDGAPVAVRGFGHADKAARRALSTTTTFQAASISKPVAALAVMRLVEQGRLDLDRPVTESLKSWELRGRRERHDPTAVTLRRILSHQAGLSVHGYPGLRPGREVPDTVTSLSGISGSNPRVVVDADPGTRWRYSGGGYTIAQLLVEEATGKPFPDAARELVLEPLDMKRSSFVRDADVDLRLAVGHDRKGRPVPPYRFAARAAAGLHTTAWDLARFLCVFMDGPAGEKPGRGVVSATTAQAMLEDQTGTVPGPEWGLGFSLTPPPEGVAGRIYGHGGSNRGWKGIALAHRETRTGVVILVNGDDAYDRVRELGTRLMESLATGR